MSSVQNNNNKPVLYNGAQGQAASAAGNTGAQASAGAHVSVLVGQPQVVEGKPVTPAPSKKPLSGPPQPAAPKTAKTGLKGFILGSIAGSTVTCAGVVAAGVGIALGVTHASWVPAVVAVMHKISALIVIGHHPVGLIIFGALGAIGLAVLGYKALKNSARRRNPDKAQSRLQARYTKESKRNALYFVRKAAVQEHAKFVKQNPGVVPPSHQQLADAARRNLPPQFAPQQGSAQA